MLLNTDAWENANFRKLGQQMFIRCWENSLLFEVDKLGPLLSISESSLHFWCWICQMGQPMDARDQKLWRLKSNMNTCKQYRILLTMFKIKLHRSRANRCQIHVTYCKTRLKSGISHTTNNDCFDQYYNTQNIESYNATFIHVKYTLQAKFHL